MGVEVAGAVVDVGILAFVVGLDVGACLICVFETLHPIIAKRIKILDMTLLIFVITVSLLHLKHAWM